MRWMHSDSLKQWDMIYGAQNRCRNMWLLRENPCAYWRGERWMFLSSGCDLHPSHSECKEVQPAGFIKVQCLRRSEGACTPFRECSLDLSSIFVPQFISRSHWAGRMGWGGKKRVAF